HQHDCVLHDVDERVADDTADALHVVEHVAHRFSGFLFGEVGERYSMQMPIERNSEVEHHLLVDPFGAVLLCHLQQTGHEGVGYYRGTTELQQAQIAAWDGDVDNLFNKPCWREIQDRRADHAGDHADRA